MAFLKRVSTEQRCPASELYFVNSCTDLAATRSVQADVADYIKVNFLHRRKFELLRLWIPF